MLRRAVQGHGVRKATLAVAVGAGAPIALVSIGAHATHPDPEPPPPPDAPEANAADVVETSSLPDANLIGAASWDPAAQPTLKIGSADSEATERAQLRLAELGYAPGAADGDYGRRSRAAVIRFQLAQGLDVDGALGPMTWVKLAEAQAPRPPPPTHTPGGVPILDAYPPNAAVTIQLFEEAAEIAGVPTAWASSSALHNLLEAESHGKVGNLNYTYGWAANQESFWPVVHAELQAGMRSARSSATGLGQLLLANVDAHYPSGRAGIGDPLEEAVGMLSYIQERHGTPSSAWSAYNSVHEGY